MKTCSKKQQKNRKQNWYRTVKFLRELKKRGGKVNFNLKADSQRGASLALKYIEIWS